jgi:hypothetical protein
MSPRRGRNWPIRGRTGWGSFAIILLLYRQIAVRLYMGGNSPEDKMSETKRQYAANYRKPPIHTRFKRGPVRQPRRPQQKEAACAAGRCAAPTLTLPRKRGREGRGVLVTVDGERRQTTKREAVVHQLP